MSDKNKEQNRPMFLDIRTAGVITESFNNALRNHTFTDPHSSCCKLATIEMIHDGVYLRIANKDDYYVYYVLKIPFISEILIDHHAAASPDQITDALRNNQLVSIRWSDGFRCCVLDISLAAGIEYAEYIEKPYLEETLCFTLA